MGKLSCHIHITLQQQIVNPIEVARGFCGLSSQVPKAVTSRHCKAEYWKGLEFFPTFSVRVRETITLRLLRLEHFSATRRKR